MKNVISKSKYVFMLLIIVFACSCSSDDGLDGLDGINGIDGINGVSGSDGINGEDGQNGSDGQDGANGNDGQNGNDGSDGQDGTNGQNGNNGQDGVDGQNGANGNNGNDGADGQDAQTYAIGDFTQGGIVFWLDETEQHGLACDVKDLNGGNTIRWYAGTNGATRAAGNGIYAGENNTSIIISALVAIGDDGGDYAALQSNELIVNQGGDSYGDWYLPSRTEITTMRSSRDLINTVALLNGGTVFNPGNYWTSTENNASSAWGYIMTGNSGGTQSKTSAFYVRAIRAF